MKSRQLTDSQIENLIEQVGELKEKLKKKNLQLTVARHRLNNARHTIKRLQGIVSYQRDRILKLYGSEDVSADV